MKRGKMVAIACLAALFSSLMLMTQGAPSPPKYVELYLEQEVDHFNFELQDTFMERYFLSGKGCKDLSRFSQSQSGRG